VQWNLTPYQEKVLNNPYDHFAFYAGVGAGKSHTGSHFAIKQVIERGGSTGIIGANTHEQLSQATLRELFYWLTEYGIEYVVDRIPPPAWNEPRLFKDYHNILAMRYDGKVTYALVRVMSNPDPIRGVEVSWYWLDELRDTDEYAHDMVLGRCRESGNIKGLVTTTTNAEGWDYKRFVLGPRPLYGSIHVPSSEAVRYGIISAKYVDTMRRSYSPMMALQELEAKHVNVFGGRAYYAASEANRLMRAPWGDQYPSRDRPLVVGCDFNFSPAPCVWVVGQVGPDMWSSDGVYFGECLHWFRELSGVGVSTPEMTERLLAQFPDFFYKVFGDMSGNVGTTSNAGQTDFDQIGMKLADAGALYSIQVEQMDEKESQSIPRVRSRVENMNALFRISVGEVRQTYDHSGCPLLDGDVRQVGWKPTVNAGRGKLDNGGDIQRTHSSDAAGYAVYRLFPPVRRASLVDSIPSSVRMGL